MKNSDRVPAFPETPHLPWKPNFQADDIIASEADAAMIFESKYDISVEEKVDGSNLGICLYDDHPIMRNRNKFLSKGDNRPSMTAKQFSSVWNWFYQNIKMFEALNESGHLTVYGDWLVAQHGIYYNTLPSWFVVYDLYDWEEHCFVNPELARPIMESAGFTLTPKLNDSNSLTLEQLEEWREQPSVLSNEGELREGVYIKVSDKNKVIRRFKMVRPGYRANALWSPKKINKNKLRLSST